MRILRRLDCYEWRIAQRLHRGSISRGKTIGEKDLRQSFPSDKLNLAKNAIDSLIKKEIIVVTPKPTSSNYHVIDRTYFENKIVIAFLEKITEDEDVKKVLLSGDLEFTETSETLITIIENHFSLYNKKQRYSLSASKEKVSDTELGLILELIMECRNHKIFNVSFEILNPNDFYRSEPMTVKCECGENHTCVAYGKILYNDRDNKM